MRKARFALVAVLAALLVAAPAAASNTKGSKRGVALAREVERALKHVPVIAYRQTGFVSMYSTLARTSKFDWRWGSGTVPAGWVKATEHITIGMRKGAIAWWRDILTPPSCSSKCIQQPVEIVLDKAGAFYAYGPYAKGRITCFNHLKGTLPHKLGEPFYTAFATFSKPSKRGGSLVMSSRYTWGKAHAQEREVISPHTHLLERFAVKVSKAGNGSPAFAFKGEMHYPSHAPKPPHVKLCHRG